MMGLPDEIDQVWMAVQRARTRLELEVQPRDAQDYAFLVAVLVLEAGTSLSHAVGSDVALHNLQLVMDLLRSRPEIPPPADVPAPTEATP